MFTGTLSDTMPQGLEESKSPLRISKLQQVLEWLGSLFDAHIQTLQRQPGSAQVCSYVLLASAQQFESLSAHGPNGPHSAINRLVLHMLMLQ